MRPLRVQEDVDVIGLSILSGAHNTICPRLMELLRAKGMNDVTVLIGGIIPDADIPALKQAGIAEVFLPGTTTQAIIDFIRERARGKAGNLVASRKELGHETVPVAGTVIQTRVDPKTPAFQKNSRDMIDRVAEIKNEEEQNSPGRRRESHRVAAQEESADCPRANRQADRSGNAFFRAGNLRRIRDVCGVGRRSGGGNDHRTRQRVRDAA